MRHLDVWTLDPEVRFLNHGSFGACPRAVLDAQAEVRARAEREPVRFFAGALTPQLDDARERLARFLDADPEGLAFVANATSGVNAVLRSLPLEAGDELLVTDHGYNACRNAAEFVAERAGARVVVARVPFPLASADEVVEAVLAAVTPRTRLALLDHVTSPTALVLPLARLIGALRERGVETLVDGAHAPGMLPLSLRELAPAWYTGNCHKWLCAPKGAGFLWVRADLRAGVRPPVISHGANARVPGRSRFRLEFDWTGTDDPSAWLAVPTAIEHLGGLLPGGWDALREHNRALAREARELLLEALELDAPAPAELLGSMASVPLPPAPAGTPAGPFDRDPLQAELYDAERVEVPIMPWAPTGGRLLRVSAQLYNERADYEALCAALVRRGR